MLFKPTMPLAPYPRTTIKRWTIGMARERSARQLGTLLIALCRTSSVFLFAHHHSTRHTRPTTFSFLSTGSLHLFLHAYSACQGSIDLFKMAGHQESDRARLFSQKMNHCNDYSMAEFLFPIDNSEAPRITQAIADEVRLSNKLKDRVKTVFLHLMKGYGFYRPRVIPTVSKLPSISWSFLSILRCLQYVSAVSAPKASTSARYFDGKKEC